MDLKKLIELSNTPKFYQEANFGITQIRTESDRYRNVIFEFINETEGNMEKIKIQKWRLTAHRCESFHNMYQKFFMPYIQLKLHTNHPLLWQYKSDILECELINYPKKIDVFLGQMYKAYVRISNNWIQASNNFFATEYAYKKKGRTIINIPENLKEGVEKVCNDQGVIFKVKNIKEQEDYNLKNLKVLIFGNDYISPDGFNMGQPYIIAHDFFANKIYG
ncbi:hypothetical protein [Aquimarina celericrescens]|uniref:Uncharacterized protein n=1 Tax=Aquimarina celericrescens TaxID=1964542 RepID=A0ABW5B1J2_9FLAO|nr:hypothetical protein [Aquimarina celericrescens]